MTQPSLFDLIEGQARRDQAVAAVADHAAADWAAAAKRCLYRLAATEAQVTADDVALALAIDHPDLRTHDPRAMGAVFTWARNHRLISPTQRFVPTSRPQGHAGPRRVWDSLIWPGSEGEDE